MKALLLAAGLGKRLRPLTDACPKTMLPIGGRPILEHLVSLARRHGVTKIAINLHYQPQAIIEYFGDGRAFGVDITYSYEASLLGSAGAAKALGTFLDEPFFVLYGDVLTDLDLTTLADGHRRSGCVASIALYQVDDPSRCGIVEVDSSGRLGRFVEKPSPGAVEGNLANAGIYLLEPEVLRHIPAGQPYDFGQHLFPKLLELGMPVCGVLANAYVLDIGSPTRYAQAQEDLRSGRFHPAGTHGAALDGPGTVLYPC